MIILNLAVLLHNFMSYTLKGITWVQLPGCWGCRYESLKQWIVLLLLFILQLLLVDKNLTVQCKVHLKQKQINSPVLLELGQEAIHFGDLLFSKSTALWHQHLLLNSSLSRLCSAYVHLSVFTCFRTWSFFVPWMRSNGHLGRQSGGTTKKACFAIKKQNKPYKSHQQEWHQHIYKIW